VTLDEGEVKSVGQRELGDVAGRVFLLLVGLEAGCEDENIMTFGRLARDPGGEATLCRQGNDEA
jgi:hypothetical protein